MIRVTQIVIVIVIVSLWLAIVIVCYCGAWGGQAPRAMPDHLRAPAMVHQVDAGFSSSSIQ
jgi:hypothetical protein